MRGGRSWTPRSFERGNWDLEEMKRGNYSKSGRPPCTAPELGISHSKSCCVPCLWFGWTAVRRVFLRFPHGVKLARPQVSAKRPERYLFPRFYLDL
jgi:hypothetical protein